MAISQTALVVAGSFGAALSAEDVARAIARGLRAGGLAQADLCPIEIERSPPAKESPSPAQTGRARRASGRPAASEWAPAPLRATTPDVAALLAGLDFDARMRGARAVVLAEAHLRESTLRGSVAFEIATRARQGGVPAYAVTGENALTAFDARILDLQMIVEASSPRG
ncbi:MAG: glycerate kinase, partial [Solirubrobacteraceae bacterium]